MGGIGGVVVVLDDDGVDVMWVCLDATTGGSVDAVVFLDLSG